MKRRRQAGYVVVLTTVVFVVLLGFMGFGIDMGILRYEKRLQQTAADAAALAGANNLSYENQSGVIAGAQAAATANGFTDPNSPSNGSVSSCGSTAAPKTVCVQINNPPQAGPHSGDSGYVEALVAEVHPTYFMRALKINQETIIARAVATNVNDTNAGCLYLLGSNSAGGFTGHGTSNKGGVIASTCGIVDNGNFTTTGHFTVCAGSIGVAGSGTGGGTNGSCTNGSPGSGVTCNDQSVSTCPAAIPAAANPLGSLTVPSQPAGSCSGNQVKTCTPGTYTSAITITGNKTLTFQPGVYVLSGNGAGVSCSGTPNISGTGVMFYLENNATFNCAGTSSLSLTAPSPTNCPSCPSWSDDILMYQDPKTDQQTDTLSGGGNSVPDEGYFGLVAIWGLNVNGNDEVFLGGTSGLGGTLPVKNAVLVE